MRLAILTQYYPPEMGAPQARLSELAQRLVARGHQVFILTAMPNYPRGKIYPGYGGVVHREKQNGVTIIRAYIYPTKSVGMIRRLANYFSFVLSSLLVGTIALPKIDYLITESPPLFLGFSGYLLSRLKRARWIFNVSDLWPESAVRLGVIDEGWSLQAAWALEKFCYKQAWLVTGQSREILQNIEERQPQVNTYHLSNGVDTSLFRPDCRNGQFRNLFGENSSCVAIYGGLHGIAQGLDQILEAAARVKYLNNLDIVFVGDGPEKETLIKKSQALGLSNVRFLEPQPREAMPSLLASADIALVPLKERLPGAVPSKVYEAMGTGLPVVMVAQGEAADIVRNSQAGLVVSPGDIEGLSQALQELTENPTRRKQLGQNGRRASIQQFDRKKIANAFIDFLEGQREC